jgi:hypothetical protein
VKISNRRKFYTIYLTYRYSLQIKWYYKIIIIIITRIKLYEPKVIGTHSLSLDCGRVEVPDNFSPGLLPRVRLDSAPFRTREVFLYPFSAGLVPRDLGFVAL